MTLMAIIKHAKKGFDGMYDTKTMIMIGSVTTIVKRLIGKQIQKNSHNIKCVSSFLCQESNYSLSKQKIRKSRIIMSF